MAYVYVVSLRVQDSWDYSSGVASEAKVNMPSRVTSDYDERYDSLQSPNPISLDHIIINGDTFNGFKRASDSFTSHYRLIIPRALYI